MFDNNVIRFSVKDINLIGNFDNGSIIGLSDLGVKLIDKLCNNDTIDINNLSEEEGILYKALNEQGYFNKDPDTEKLKAAYFHVTNDCNLHCLGCYSCDDSRNSGELLTFDEICIALKKLKSLGIHNVIISGGEPFLRKDIYDIFDYVKSVLKIPSLQVVTNGTQSSNYNSSKLIKYVSELVVSIDGYNEKHPTFIRDTGIFGLVLGNAIALKNNGVNVKLLATLHRKNIDDAGQYIYLSKQLQIPLSFSILTSAGNFRNFEDWIPTQEQLTCYGKGGMIGLDDVYKNAKGTDFIVSVRRSCGGGKNIFSVGSDGTIYPCHMLHNQNLKLGNIVTDDIAVLHEKCLDFSKTISVSNISVCRDCDYKYLCGGGCRAHAYAAKGDLIGEDTYCTMNKEYFDVVFAHLLAQIGGG